MVDKARIDALANECLTKFYNTDADRTNITMYKIIKDMTKGMSQDDIRKVTVEVHFMLLFNDK